VDGVCKLLTRSDLRRNMLRPSPEIRQLTKPRKTSLASPRKTQQRRSKGSGVVMFWILRQCGRLCHVWATAAYGGAYYADHSNHRQRQRRRQWDDLRVFHEIRVTVATID